MTRPIARIGLAHVQVPYKDIPQGPEADAATVLRESLLLAIETGAGPIGLGECAPAHPADLERCWQALATRIVPRLLGQTVTDVPAIAEQAGRWGVVPPAAAAGAETALWDLVGQQAHRSLADLMQASTLRIETGVAAMLRLGLYPTVVDLVRAIEPHLAEGYQALSVLIAPGRDVEFVAALRQHFPELPLAVEAGGRFGPEHACLFEQLDDQVDLWIDQPYPADQVEALASLQARLSCPISISAADEAGLAGGAGRMARLSIQELGGLGPALDRHNRCCDHGVGCWVSVGPELGIGLAQAIHLATMPNCKDPSGVAPAVRWFVDDVVLPPIECEVPGRFRVSTRPGLGHVLDTDRVRAHQVRHAEWTLP